MLHGGQRTEPTSNSVTVAFAADVGLKSYISYLIVPTLSLGKFGKIITMQRVVRTVLAACVDLLLLYCAMGI
jgi:hypothetical protein